MQRLLAIALFLSWISPLGAAQLGAEHTQAAVPASAGVAAAPAATPSTICPPSDRLSEVSQSDCCKGHKGVCGCRAGKIVCCDNTTSATCACHGDSGVEN